MAQEFLPNVIVFGETGAGKSSVINMLDGSTRAEVSSSAMGVSTRNICYKKTISNTFFNVFDTAGLNEGTGGTVSPRAAIEMLHNLICRLNDGVSLLVFVMRAPRVTASAQQIYRMFYDIVCDKKVPIVIVITGLEFESDIDGWFRRNREAFYRQRMLFAESACITAISTPIEGKPQIYQESKERVERVIYENYTREPLKMSRRNWFAEAVLKMFDVFGFKSSDINDETLALIKSCGGLTDWEAKSLARKIKRQAKKRG